MAKKEKTAAQPVTASREEVIKTILSAVQKNLVLQHEGKPLTAFMAMSLTIEKIQTQLININSLVEAIKNVNVPMLTCPNTACEAPVLLEMGKCYICETELMTTEPAPKEAKVEVVQEAKTETTEQKKEEVKQTKTAKSKITKTDKDEPLLVPKVNADAAPKTAKERNAETMVIPKDQDSAGSIPTVPSDKEIDAMDVAGLRAFYKGLGLPIDEKAHNIKKVGELRQLVKSVLAAYIKEQKDKAEKAAETKAKKDAKEDKPAKAGKKEKKNKYEKQEEDENSLDEDLDLEETLSDETDEDAGDFDDLDFDDSGVEEIEEETEDETEDEFNFNVDDVEDSSEEDDDSSDFDDEDFEDEE